MREPTWPQKWLAEFIGTWALVFIGPGAAAVTLMLAEGTQRATPFNIGIGALGGLGDWLAVGLAFGFIITAVIYSIGHISGAHINPAVTIGLASKGRFPSAQVIPYIVAQLAGAILGSLTLLALLGTRGATVGGLGAPGPFPGIAAWQAYLAEAVGTFILMWTIMGVAVDQRAPKGWAGLVIGLVVAGVIVTLGNISGAGINPARTFGPVFIASLVPDAPRLWVHFLGYALAPIIGAIVAVFLYDAVAASGKGEAAEEGQVGKTA
jgi:glycerol uptake facilitator protein